MLGRNASCLCMTTSLSPPSRRPLKSRSSRWAGAIAAGLAQAGVTPNAISFASVVFAAFGAAAFIGAGRGWWAPWLGWLLGAVCIQLRLLCNLFDGMVAIEGGKRSATGDVWNEAPDRLADILLLGAAGVGGGVPWAGALAAVASVLTAYLRALGASLTGEQDFSGPFAKPQRMAVLTGVALLMAVSPFWPPMVRAFPYVLWAVAVGTFFTFFRRWWRLDRRLRLRKP